MIKVTALAIASYGVFATSLAAPAPDDSALAPIVTSYTTDSLQMSVAPPETESNFGDQCVVIINTPFLCILQCEDPFGLVSYVSCSDNLP